MTCQEIEEQARKVVAYTIAGVALIVFITLLYHFFWVVVIVIAMMIAMIAIAALFSWLLGDFDICRKR